MMDQTLLLYFLLGSFIRDQFLDFHTFTSPRDLCYKSNESTGKLNSFPILNSPRFFHPVSVNNFRNKLQFLKRITENPLLFDNFKTIIIIKRWRWYSGKWLVDDNMILHTYVGTWSLFYIVIRTWYFALCLLNFLYVLILC